MFSIEGDHDALDESDRLDKEWYESLLETDTQQVISRFVAKHRKGVPTEVRALEAGGLNALLRVQFIDGASAVIRFTKPGKTMFPEEKIRIEVATTRSHIPGLSKDIAPVLDPNIDETKLEGLYRQVSGVLLQLSRLEFPLIGALEEIDEWQWEVRTRPLSMPLNELVRRGTFPRAKLPAGSFQSSSKYFESLASLHVDHLFHQRNDVVESETDCRRKYTARKLFQKLAREKKLIPDSHGPFKFWCDGLRPSNILLNDQLEIAAVIDWEFSYAAPCEYTYSPPWWLLIERPEFWHDGLADWTEKYERRLKTFLKVMTETEDAGIAAGQLREDQRLSRRMRESWDSGEFWTVYATRESFGFDDVYWAKLDHQFFGPHEGKLEDAWMHRLGLLDEQTRAGMEPLVAKKLEEMKTRQLAWEPDE
ncbi:phosphotransferase family protein [Beauveria bassiana ARSEF 2860]|uniref:Phosphotransferase family protein n=1 Tax=Beauveria bassiana (strain ARSEF 2860) TaxID=655819 RepID=J5JDQ0_BEAB2|nr:phosphotransferase family protein [Beauveria bassiana ARSEF 2860]EJP61896.1 phosphotransferase family protein [Beauveria bassiana ARSEF 2860]